VRVGPFEVDKRIGQGGMGQVWRGVHREQGVPVAVKVITADRARNTAQQRAFAREVSAVAGLEHPGVTMLFDFGTISQATAEASEGAFVAESPYLAMELAHGTLPLKVLPWHGLRSMLLCLLDALGHAHARGIVHRDLKPANILVFLEGASPVYKLCDFGIAFAMEGAEAPASLGSPMYMAPEQIRGRWRQYGPGTDLYALGAIAWLLSVGRAAFGGTGPAAITAKLQGDLGPFAPRTAVPPGFEHWLRVLLAPDPRERFALAADAAWALQGLGDPTGGYVVRPMDEEARGDSATSPFTLRVGDLSSALEGTTQPVERGEAPAWPVRRSLAPAFERPPAPLDWRRSWSRRSMRLHGAGLGLYGLRRPPMAGRSAERDALWEALCQVCREGSAGAVVLEGRAGTGKSHLARWLCERAEEVGAARSMCAVHGERGGAADGLVAMLRRSLRCEGSADVEDRLRWVFPHAPALLLSRLGAVLDPGRGQSVTRQERLGVIGEALVGWSSRRPVVVWIDDAQWGSRAVELALRLLGCEAPILFLLTVRHEAEGVRRSAAQALERLRPDAAELRVERLSTEAHSALVQGLLGLEPGLAERVERRTAGVPLFAVQLVDDWVQRRILELGPAGFRLREGAQALLPDALHTLWVQRVDHLLEARPADRLPLEVAALLGPSVEATEWAESCSVLKVEAPVDLVDRMVQHGLASHTAQGWAFAHPMLPESLTRLCAEEGRGPVTRRACSEGLATVGERRHERGRPREARDLFRRALAFADAPGRQGWIRGRLGVALRLLGRMDEAEEQLRGAWKLHRAAGNQLHEAHELCSLGTLFYQTARWTEAVTFLGDSLVLYRSLGNAKGESAALSNLAILHLHAGRLHQAREAFEACLEIRRALGDRHGEGQVLENLAVVHMQTGRFDQALPMLETALSFHQEVGHSWSVSMVLSTIGSLHRFCGRGDEARAMLGRALGGTRQGGDRRTEGIVLANLAELDLDEGQIERAYERVERAIAVLETIGEGHARGVFLGLQGRVLARMGDTEGAARSFEQGQALLTQVSDKVELAKLLCWRGLFELQRDAVSGAEGCLSQARELSTGHEERWGLQLGLERLADALRRRPAG
jgi:eukaryotic-like serine/threonine-protein kinase